MVIDPGRLDKYCLFWFEWLSIASIAFVTSSYLRWTGFYQIICCILLSKTLLYPLRVASRLYSGIVSRPCWTWTQRSEGSRGLTISETIGKGIPLPLARKMWCVWLSISKWSKVSVWHVTLPGFSIWLSPIEFLLSFINLHIPFSVYQRLEYGVYSGPEAFDLNINGCETCKSL